MFSIKPDPIISPGHFRVYVLPQKTCLSAREQNKPANLPPRGPSGPGGDEVNNDNLVLETTGKQGGKLSTLSLRNLMMERLKR